MTAFLLCLGGLVLLSFLPRTSWARWSLRPYRRTLHPRIDLHRFLRRNRHGTRKRQAVITLCRVLAAELRAGQPPEEALRLSVFQAGSPVGPISDSASLRTAAEDDPDLWALAYLAVCWEVAADTGAGPASVVDQLAESLTEQEEQRAEALARTTGPRTTAIVLSGLPLVGVAMSAGLGGSPLTFLFTTPVGLVCLFLGLTLNLLGLWWTVRMLRSAVASF